MLTNRFLYVCAGIFLLSLAVAVPARVQSAEKLPTPSVVPIESRADATKKYFQDKALRAAEGIWLEDNNEIEMAIISAPPEFAEHCDYVGVITRTKRSNWKWKIGEVKMLLTESATPGLYSALYRSTSTKEPTSCWATITANGGLTIDLQSGGRNYVRLFPKSSPVESSSPSVPPSDRVYGSGFMLTPTTVVTSFHVVRGSRATRVVIGPLTIPARMLLQDERNDLVVLQIQPADSLVARMLGANTTCLAVRGDTPSSGERVFALGFPLADLVNTGVVITEGLISNAVGPNGEAGILQTSAAVQPGISGGPLLDEQGRVVGVLSATANSALIYSKTGALPQNVNFAISADPLRAMVKFLPSAECEHPAAGAKAMIAQEIKARCARAVVKVEADR